MVDFKKTFPFVVLLSLWVVMLMSINQIKRSLIPLKKLQEGTQRIAMRDFNSRVTVSSGDEFEDLAASFNSMASRLDRQFNAMITIDEIVTAILSTLDTEKIVETVLTHMRDVCPCDSVSVTLLDSNDTDSAQVYMRGGNPGGEKLEEVISLTPEEVQKLQNNPKSLMITDMDRNFPSYIAPMGRHGFKSFLISPVFLKQKLSCIITMGYLEAPEHDKDDLNQARQLADQVAVALSNSRLVKELDQLNWGTLTALALAIDEKSPWTSGHSGRVTNMALKIGKVFGFNQEELDNLHRAGLLHDIGKIGTPPDILDKHEKLTNEEYRIIQEHPGKGARILKPIKAYADIIPIVKEHHEWFNGKGYPNGLAGEALSLGSRIMAVADTFDAIISDRPYRSGMSREGVIECIKEGAGNQFDPMVVQAFLEVMALEKKESENAKVSIG
jgi:putative nucleotidyltransferase with HDIG domain